MAACRPSDWEPDRRRPQRSSTSGPGERSYPAQSRPGPRIAFRLHTLSVLRFRFECPCSCGELPARSVSGVERTRKSAARQIKGGIARKKAQKTRKLFVNSVPFVAIPSVSELQLQRELDLARGCGRIGNLAG